MYLDLHTFVPAHTALVCVDSDGCVMNTMNEKHQKVFCPELIRAFGLEAYARTVRDLWEEVNLRGVTRGINRFKGMVLVFERLYERTGVQVPGLSRIRKWTESAGELSNPALESEVRRTESADLERALEWSLSVNRKIAACAQMGAPFDGAEEALRAIREAADTAVVSSANAEALHDEWTRCGLARWIDVMLGQEVGTKAACIAAMLGKGYDRGNVLMVGDAPGDLDAAQENGVLFYPILVDREAESFKRFSEEALARFCAGTYAGSYQEGLIREHRESFDSGSRKKPT